MKCIGPEVQLPVLMASPLRLCLFLRHCSPPPPSVDLLWGSIDFAFPSDLSPFFVSSSSNQNSFIRGLCSFFRRPWRKNLTWYLIFFLFFKENTFPLTRLTPLAPLSARLPFFSFHRTLCLPRGGEFRAPLAFGPRSYSRLFSPPKCGAPCPPDFPPMPPPIASRFLSLGLFA